MHSPRSLVRGFAAGVTVIAVAVAGCSSSSTSPKPSPGSSASILDSFRSQVTASDFQYEGPITGNVLINDIAAPVTGTSKGKGRDSSTSISFTLMGQAVSQDQITVGASTYSRSNGSTWSKTARTHASFADLFGAGMKMEDKGVETRSGQQLHRLEPTNLSDLDLASIGVGAPEGVSNFQISLVVWVKADGTPVSLNQGETYDVEANSLHVSMSLDVTFDKLSGVTIEAPAM